MTVWPQQDIYVINVENNLQNFQSTDELCANVNINDTTLQQSTDAENITFSICNMKMKKIFLISVDIVIVLLVFGINTAIELNWLPTTGSGFFCNDPKLSYKYQGDTISSEFILFSTLVVPFFIILACELYQYVPDLYKSSSTQNRCVISIVRSLKRYREYMIGIILLLLVIQVCKSTFGEPRPHFFDTCKPDAAINCTNSIMYISQYKCTNKNLSRYTILDSYRSFPSGHAALGAYSALYFMYYFHKIFNKHQLWMFKPILHVLCFLWMLFTSLSRIKDHRHHWWDTLAGVVLGASFCYYTIKAISSNFRKHDNQCNNENCILKNVTTSNGTHQLMNGVHHKHHPSIKRLLSSTSTTSYLENEKEMSDINSTTYTTHQV